MTETEKREKCPTCDAPIAWALLGRTLRTINLIPCHPHPTDGGVFMTTVHRCGRTKCATKGADRCVA